MATRAQSKAETRERLINAGMDLVRDRGFGVSVDELARAADLTKGAIYSNFGDRGELIAAISERLHYELNVDLPAGKRDLAQAASDLGQQIAHVVDEDRSKLVLTLDFVVQLLRDESLRERILPRASIPEYREQLRSGEWLHGYESPLPGDQYNMVTNALGTGLGIYRALYGRDAVPEELITWAMERVSQPEPRKTGGRKR